MWQTLQDIWDKASKGMKWFMILIIPVLVCFYFTVTNIDVAGIFITKDDAIHQLHEKNAIDSVRRIMFRYFGHRVDSLEAIIDSLKHIEGSVESDNQ